MTKSIRFFPGPNNNFEIIIRLMIHQKFSKISIPIIKISVSGTAIIPSSMDYEQFTQINGIGWSECNNRSTVTSPFFYKQRMAALCVLH